MTGCCSPKGYRWVFSERSARAEARRYRRKGLDRTSRRIVDFLKEQGASEVEEIEAVEERVTFTLPPEMLREKAGRVPAGS